MAGDRAHLPGQGRWLDGAAGAQCPDELPERRSDHSAGPHACAADRLPLTRHGSIEVAEAQQSFVIRRAEKSEAGLIRDLRFASLLSFEMQGDPLKWLGAITAALPDVDAGLIRDGRYF